MKRKSMGRIVIPERLVKLFHTRVNIFRNNCRDRLISREMDRQERLGIRKWVDIE